MITLNSEESKQYIYDEAANGMMVKIQADRYEQWKKKQDQIRDGSIQNHADISNQLNNNEQTLSRVSEPKKKGISNVLSVVLSLICVALAVFSLCLYQSLMKCKADLDEAEKVISYAEDLLEYAEADRETALNALDNDDRLHTEGLDPESDEYLNELLANKMIYIGVKSNYLELFQDYCAKHWQADQ